MLTSGGALLADVLFLRGSSLVTGLVLALVPAVTAPSGLLVKMLLFGRMKHRVVLDEVYPEHATRKWIAVLVAIAGIAALLIAVERILGNLVFAAVTAVLLVGVFLLSRRLFP
jgi:NAD(P)-dependent dehydrogenase (short-subunit alcohol dehydrogenase family)